MIPTPGVTTTIRITQMRPYLIPVGDHVGEPMLCGEDDEFISSLALFAVASAASFGDGDAIDWGK